jgi:hypothetical protein
MTKSAFAILLICFLIVPLAAAGPTDPVPYEINHGNTDNGQLPGISVSPGQKIQFRIINTDWRCFKYNAKELKNVVNPAELSLAIQDPTVFTFSTIIHDEETATYQIDVVRKPDAEIASAAKSACDASTLANRSWTIPVRTVWRFAMSGAITGDTLTKPEYFLEKGKAPDPTDSTKSIDGFFVRKNGAGQDRLRFGMAAMAHLYRSQAGLWGISWAPISFGVGLQDNEVQYFVGTTLRFGTRAFITGGVTAGPRDRLPNNLAVGKFTTESTALDSLPKKTSQGVFVSIGLSFFEANAGKLTGLIAKP